MSLLLMFGFGDGFFRSSRSMWCYVLSGQILALSFYFINNFVSEHHA